MSKQLRELQAFANSVAVANVRRFIPALTNLSRYVAPSERGTGFAEMAATLLAARGDLP